MYARKKSSEPIPRVCLSLESTCVALGEVGRDTVRQLIKNGELASIRIGRRHVVPLRSIDQLVARQLEAAGASNSQRQPTADGAYGDAA